jgi:hypothetical protein
MMRSNDVSQEISDGYFQYVITTMGSIGRHDGYFSKFSLILRNFDRNFVTQIKQLQMDDVQTIYMAGILIHNCQPTFCLAYGNFDYRRFLS